MDESFAWLLQAAADREAAELLAANQGAKGYCHAIAKWQQTVEKAVKAMVAALRDAGVLHIEIGYKHGVERFIGILVSLPRAKDNRKVQQQLHGLLDQETRAGIGALDALVPHRPLGGADPQRNTEYPFVDPEGEWTYPAADNVFSSDEIQRFRRLAQRIIERAGRIVSAIHRMP